MAARHALAALAHHAREIGEERRRPPLRLVTMTESGRRNWSEFAQPKIRAYYEEILADFSINDAAHMLHYLLKMLKNMQRLDRGAQAQAAQ